MRLPEAFRLGERGPGPKPEPEPESDAEDDMVGFNVFVFSAPPDSGA